MKRAATFLLCLLSAGCATYGGQDTASPQLQNSAQSRELHADLIRGMIAQGRYHAALAHLEELEKQHGRNDEQRLLRAQVLGKLGRTAEAEEIYRSLLDGRFEGDARHGLGLLYSGHNPALSLEYLQAATRLKPADAAVRNDYGYALLLAGRYGEAKMQLATAYELEPASEMNRNNYIVALILLQDEREVQRIARATETSSQTLGKLRKRAKDLSAKTSTAAKSRKATTTGTAGP
jgi:Flp pilus assembly protein TadD